MTKFKGKTIGGMGISNHSGDAKFNFFKTMVESGPNHNIPISLLQLWLSNLYLYHIHDITTQQIHLQATGVLDDSTHFRDANPEFFLTMLCIVFD